MSEGNNEGALGVEAAETEQGVVGRKELLEAVSFAGETLGRFFMQDPRTGDAQEAFAALASLDADAVASEWPFVEKNEARVALSLMIEGLAAGINDDLTWEYRRLFIGPAPKPAPPWGSVYMDRECVIFGDTTLALRTWMRKHGIARLSDEKTPEDHIGLMLELMAWISSNAPDLLEEYLRLHLLTWSSHYLEQLADAARHPFYEGLAHCTQATLEGIRRELDIEVTHPKFYR